VDWVFICWTNQSGLCQLKRITDSSRQQTRPKCVRVSEAYVNIRTRRTYLLLNTSGCWMLSVISTTRALFYFSLLSHSRRIVRTLIIISAEMIRRSNGDRMPFPSINAVGLVRLSCRGHHRACGKKTEGRMGRGLDRGGAWPTGIFITTVHRNREMTSGENPESGRNIQICLDAG